METIKKLLALYMPKPLPLTDAGFDGLCRLVFWAAKLPDNDSTRQALGTMILHADKNRYRFQAVTFVRSMLRSAASQAAYNAVMDIRDREKAAKEAHAKAEQSPDSQVGQETSQIRLP